MSSHEVLREHIKSCLKDEDTIKQISLMRTQFTHIMSEFYFFNIFFRILKSLNIEYSRTECNTIDGDTSQFYFINFYKSGVIYTTVYNHNKLIEDIKEFNFLQGDMGMLESANALVDIFISLLI